MQLIWDIHDYLQQGGWIMIPLVAVSLVMWGLIVDRLRDFAALSRDVSNEQAVQALASGHLASGSVGLRAQLLAAFLEERSGHGELDREILQQCAMGLRQGIDRHLAVIAVLAGIAPLLGLLGTVLGMIETFDVISIFGTGNARALAGGISVALITTQTGLLVAIPGLLMSNRLGRVSQRLKTSLDEAVALLSRHVVREGKMS